MSKNINYKSIIPEREGVCTETRRRIMVAVWAYAYEEMNDSLVDDYTFDMESLLIDVDVPTGNRKMDRWFKENFNPSTGMWVKDHPGRVRLDEIYWNLKNPDRKTRIVHGKRQEKPSVKKGWTRKTDRKAAISDLL